jgi:hypothetical protein
MNACTVCASERAVRWISMHLELFHWICSVFETYKTRSHFDGFLALCRYAYAQRHFFHACTVIFFTRIHTSIFGAYVFDMHASTCLILVTVNKGKISHGGLVQFYVSYVLVVLSVFMGISVLVYAGSDPCICIYTRTMCERSIYTKYVHVYVHIYNMCVCMYMYVHVTAPKHTYAHTPADPFMLDLC